MIQYLPQSLFVIGLENDSDIRYGVAAYWTVYTNTIYKWKGGATWGVAYTNQNELDEALNGLLGYSFINPNETITLTLGVAVGKTTYLDSSVILGETQFAVDEVIPTVS